MVSAYLLVSHGSSDPRHGESLQRLAAIVRQHLGYSPTDSMQSSPLEWRQSVGPFRSFVGMGYPVVGSGSTKVTTFSAAQLPHESDLHSAPVVGVATLEAAERPLAEQIRAFAAQAAVQGVHQIVIIPLFLLAGVHTQEDLPREIAAARSLLPAQVKLVCTAHLGAYPGFKRFVASRLEATTADRYLLLSHGSRRLAGNRSIQQLGAILNADVAFWSVHPGLEAKVVELMQQGYQRITVLPYFLFPGSITDAVTRQTEDLAERLSRLSLRLLPPLGTNAGLGRVAAALALHGPDARSVRSLNGDQWRMEKSGMTA